MKHTPKILNAEGIRQWDLIKKDFIKSPLLLGNGFSLNFSTKLLYKNLYDNYIKNCSDEITSLFKEFDSYNFEIILEHLESTERVCKALNINHDRISKNKNLIKQGLIDSINRIHPTPDQIKLEQIRKVAEQIKEFDQIFTTNYDLFSYYLILESKKFGDYFYFENYSDNRFKLFNSGDELNNNHIYYLHGALFLFDKSINTLKIKRDENWLIEVITKEITSDNYPLFISEGTHEMKLKAIQSNNYLSYCFRHLKENKSKKMVVFGQSLSNQDLHIVQAIDNSYEKIAYGIRITENKKLKEIKAELNRVRSLFKKTEIEFFDSSTLFDFE